MRLGDRELSLNEIRNLFHESSRSILGEKSVFENGRGEDYYWFTSGLQNHWFNQLTLYSNKVELLDQAVVPFFKRTLAHSVFLGGAGLVHAETLIARGYKNSEATPTLGLQLDPIKNRHVIREGLELVRVHSDQDLKACRDLMSGGFGMSEELTHTYISSTLGKEDCFRYFVTDNGVPVSTAFFVKTGTFLACFDVATPPEHQRKGYADELLKSVFSLHAELGDEVVVLQASKAGYPVYIRLGFELLEYCQQWFIDDTAVMARFHHRELVLGEFTLRPFTSEDQEWWIELNNDPEVQRWTPAPKESTEKEFAALLKRVEARVTNGSGIDWLVERNGVPVAAVLCHSTDWRRRATEIGFATAPNHRGQGILPEVLKQLIPFLFKEYGFERIETRADVRNTGSQRVSEKAGMTFEGVLRRNYINGDEITDDAVYSIIKDDLAR